MKLPVCSLDGSSRQANKPDEINEDSDQDGGNNDHGFELKHHECKAVIQ